MPAPDPASGGGPHLLMALGQTWTFEPISPGLRKKFSAWGRMKARAALHEQRGEMTSAMYQERLSSLEERITAGSYSWGSPLDPKRLGSGLNELLQSDEGQAELGRLLLEKHHPAITAPVVFEIMQENTEGFIAALKGALDTGPVPNATTPQEAEKTPQTTD